VKIDSRITIYPGELSRKKRERLYKALSFIDANAQLWTCYLEYPNKLEIPRGAWHLVGELDYEDKRTKPEMPKLKYTFELDRIDIDPRFEGQSQCVEKMLHEEQGLIVRAPGTGKTEIAVAFAAQCETTVLILVHTKDILDQWVERLERALPGTPIGVIQGPTFKLGQITVAMVQSLRRLYTNQTFWPTWGAVILDEAHHGAAKSFEAVLNHLPAFYRFGFTASPTRADGMHPYLQHLIGPVIHKQKFSTPINTKVKPVYSKFKFNYRGRWDWAPMLDDLISDPERNGKIGRIIDREVQRGNSVLVLSRRIEHLERIARSCNSSTEILTAGRGRNERKRILNEFRKGRIKSILATQLADEALDVPRCNRLILAYPGKHDGRLTQQIGRAIRKFEGKQDAVIYDVVDKRVRPLSRQWRERLHAYRKLHIHVKKHSLKIGGRNGR
jgi:superfamily II DNA or RNA helicase